MKIAIFASGTGSNAVKIIEHFKDRPQYQFVVLSNKKDAPVLEKAQKLGIQTHTFDRKDFYESEKIVDFLKTENIIRQFPNKIINLHPALLPKFGGKGMFGSRVHEAVIAAGEKESGITIHYVSEKYDEGKVIFQAKCELSEGETAESLAQKIHQLEHKYLPQTVEKLVKFYL